MFPAANSQHSGPVRKLTVFREFSEMGAAVGEIFYKESRVECSIVHVV